MVEFEMRQLEYFVAAASAGSYSQAAKLLYVSPQAISKGVQVLEGRIGIPLFKRSSNGIELTEFGSIFKEKADGVLNSLEQIQLLAEQYRSSHLISLSVGIHSLCFRENGGSIDRSDLLTFQDEHQQVESSFAEMKGDAIIESVVDGTLDFGISVLWRETPQSIDTIVLKKFPIAALVSSRYDNFINHGSITIEELSHGELVLFSGEQDFNGFFIDQAKAEKQTIDVSPLQISSHSDIDFIIDHMIYVIRPLQHAYRTVKNQHISIVPIVNKAGESIEMPLNMFWKSDRQFSKTDQEFFALVKESYR